MSGLHPAIKYSREYWDRRMKRMARELVNVQPTASPHNKKYWPHQTEVDWDKVQEIERWCYLHFKSGNWRNNGQWFAFKREQDYILFVLKWS